MSKYILLSSGRVSFLEQSPEQEKAILFLHGNSLDALSFSHQMNDPGLAEYRLIALDLPGHGKSFRNGHYSVPGLARIIAEFIEEIGLREFILVGHSLGGHVVLESLRSLSPSGIMVIGTPPVLKSLPADIFLPHPDLGLLYQDELSSEEIRKLLVAFGTSSEPANIERFKKTDSNFRSRFAQSIAQGEYEDEMEIYTSLKIPKAMVLGTRDPIVNRAYLENVVGPVTLIAGGHSVHEENPKAFNDILSAFAEESFYPGLENFLPTAQTEISL